jgi:hypothetical protein
MLNAAARNLEKRRLQQEQRNKVRMKKRKANMPVTACSMYSAINSLEIVRRVTSEHSSCNHTALALIHSPRPNSDAAPNQSLFKA